MARGLDGVARLWEAIGDAGEGRGEVGREGVAIDSLADMETLFAGIPLGEVSTSMTINAPAAILLAFYLCVGEAQGVPRAGLRGTVQTDILKEYIAQKEWIFPPAPSMRLVVDMIECLRAVWGTWREVPDNAVLERRDNPTGRAVACWTPQAGVMCFVPPPQS